MTRAIVAYFHLAVAFWINILLLRPWRKRRGLAQFRKNYRPDRLRPMSLAHRKRQPLHTRCIQCGLCIEAFDSVKPLAAVVRWSRSGHDAWTAKGSAEQLLGEGEALRAAEAICPTRVPIGDVASYIVRAAENVEQTANLASPLE